MHQQHLFPSMRQAQLLHVHGIDTALFLFSNVFLTAKTPCQIAISDKTSSAFHFWIKNSVSTSKWTLQTKKKIRPSIIQCHQTSQKKERHSQTFSFHSAEGNSTVKTEEKYKKRKKRMLIYRSCKECTNLKHRLVQGIDQFPIYLCLRNWGISILSALFITC